MHYGAKRRAAPRAVANDHLARSTMPITQGTRLLTRHPLSRSRRLHRSRGSEHGAPDAIRPEDRKNSQVHLSWALLFALEGNRAKAVREMDAPTQGYAALVPARVLPGAECYAVMGDAPTAIDWLRIFKRYSRRSRFGGSNGRMLRPLADDARRLPLLGRRGDEHVSARFTAHVHQYRFGGLADDASTMAAALWADSRRS
jgi:hypothetical protein